MRLEPDDLGARDARIFLDGTELTDVMWADTDLGKVCIAIRAKDRQLFAMRGSRPGDEEVCKAVLKGRVDITFDNSEPDMGRYWQVKTLEDGSREFME